MLKESFKVVLKSLAVMTLALMCQSIMAQPLALAPDDSDESGIPSLRIDASASASEATYCYIEYYSYGDLETDSHLYIPAGGSLDINYLSTPEDCCDFDIDLTGLEDCVSVSVNCQDKVITISVSDDPSCTGGYITIATFEFLISIE